MSEIQELTAELSECKSENARLQVAVDRLQGVNIKLTAEVASLRDASLRERIEGQSEEIQRLERSRADLKKFREQAFLDHWMQGQVKRYKRSLESLGQRLGSCQREQDRLREATTRAEQEERKAQHERDEFEVDNFLLREALEGLAEFDTDWTLDLDENMSRARAAARRALRKEA